MVALIICFLASVVIGVVYYKYFQHSDRVPPLANGYWPIMGHAHILLGGTEKLYKKFHTLFVDSMNNGIDVLLLKIWGLYFYVVMNPDDGFAVTTSCLKKDYFYKFFRPWLADGLLTTNNTTRWRAHRKLIALTFQQNILDGYLTVFNRQSRKLVRSIAVEVDKAPFDPCPYIQKMSMNTMCATAIGSSDDDEDGRLEQSLLDANLLFTKGMTQRAINFLMHSDFLFNWTNLKKRQDKIATLLHGLTDTMMQKRIAELKKGQDKTEEQLTSGPVKAHYKSFLDILIEQSKEGLLKEEHIREEVDGFILAGLDTATSAITYILLAIGTFSKVRERVLEELDEVLQGSNGDVDKQDLSRLVYLEAVIKETMRLYPVVPMIARHLDKDMELKNYTIPAGSRCFVILASILRHPVWGPDAAEYRPERWLDPACLPESSHAFAAFGLGRRNCLGVTFSMMMMKTTLAHMLREYTVSGNIHNLTHKLEVLSRPASGFFITIQKRLKKN